MAAYFRTQPAATNFDRVNNTVSVSVADPTPGTWTAQVTAHNVPEGPQPYALVMSGLTSVVATSGSASVAANSAQPDAPTLTVNTVAREDATIEDVNRTNGTDLTAVYGGQVSYKAVITGNYGQGLVSMRYGITDLPAVAAGSLTLAKLLGYGRSLSFTYPSTETYADGTWWLADAGGTYIDPVRVLDPSATYFVVSTVKDNGPYDTNSTLNGVNDPQVLGVSPSAGSAFGSGGGGGGGCTVGAGAGVGMGPGAALAVAALVLAWRRRRQRR
jgi:hypothetical protein